MDPPELPYLRAGIALFNEGYYLAAHEPWEEAWLQKPASDRNDCLQGLIQTAGAIHHATEGNNSGMIGLAESAQSYLQECPNAIEPVQELQNWLSQLVVTPTLAESSNPPKLVFNDRPIRIDDLQMRELLLAAEGLADTRDDSMLYRAVKLGESMTSKDDHPDFTSLIQSYMTTQNGGHRKRLSTKIKKHCQELEAVQNIFDEENHPE